MQPPVTEPSIPPLSSISIWAPGSSGAEPIRSTSVAITTRWPSRSQAAAVLSAVGIGLIQGKACNYTD